MIHHTAILKPPPNIPRMRYCKLLEVGKNFAVAELNCNLLENIHGWPVVLHGQGLLHRLCLCALVCVPTLRLLLTEIVLTILKLSGLFIIMALTVDFIDERTLH